MHNHMLIDCDHAHDDEDHIFPRTMCFYQCLTGFHPSVISGTSLQVQCHSDTTWSHDLAECVPIPPMIFCSSIQTYAGVNTSWTIPEALDYNENLIEVRCDDSSTSCPNERGTVFEMSCEDPVLCYVTVTYTATTDVGGQASCDVTIAVSQMRMHA